VAGHDVTWLDVFTDRPLAGNGLAVVHGADDLADDTMLAIARETRLSETTFVQSATQGGADYRNRIFTTHTELPFAGHPSLGTAVAVARARGETSARYVQETGAGLQPVEVRLDGASAHASMLQGAVQTGAEPDPDRIAAALGLAAGDLHGSWAPQVVSTGVPQLMIAVRDDGALDGARPDGGPLAALLDELGVVCAYLAAVDERGGTALARSFFLGDAGIQEDPATGSAVGPLVAYTAQRAGIEALTVTQGVHIGRPSTLHASIDAEGVRVAGDVVVLAEGRSLL
jgi:trans-2,3-dihydro-3-hydroxyanthranilate isomerase